MLSKKPKNDLLNHLKLNSKNKKAEATKLDIIDIYDEILKK